MKDEQRIDLTRKVLRIRTIFKLISQVSWNLAQLEKNFPINHVDIYTLNSLLDAYQEHFNMLEEAMEKFYKEFDS